MRSFFLHKTPLCSGYFNKKERRENSRFTIILLKDALHHFLGPPYRAARLRPQPSSPHPLSLLRCIARHRRPSGCGYPQAPRSSSPLPASAKAGQRAVGRRHGGLLVLATTAPPGLPSRCLVHVDPAQEQHPSVRLLWTSPSILPCPRAEAPRR